MAVPAHVKSPIPGEYLGSSPRQVLITGTDLGGGDVKLADYGGGPCRSLILIGGGVLVYRPDSPADDDNPILTLPTLPALTALDIAVHTIVASTTAVPILVLF